MNALKALTLSAHETALTSLQGKCIGNQNVILNGYSNIHPFTFRPEFMAKRYLFAIAIRILFVTGLIESDSRK